MCPRSDSYRNDSWWHHIKRVRVRAGLEMSNRSHSFSKILLERMNIILTHIAAFDLQCADIMGYHF